MDRTESDSCKCSAQYFPSARTWEWYPALHFLPQILKPPQQMCSGSCYRSGFPWQKFGFHLLLINTKQNTIFTGSLTSLQGAKGLICSSEIISPQWLKPQDSVLREWSNIENQQRAHLSLSPLFLPTAELFNTKPYRAWLLALLRSLTRKQPLLGLWDFLCLLGWVYLLFSKRKD